MTPIGHQFKSLEWSSILYTSYLIDTSRVITKQKTLDLVIRGTMVVFQGVELHLGDGTTTEQLSVQSSLSVDSLKLGP